MDEKIYSELRRELDKIAIIDTHEHFILEQERLELELDLFYLFPHYASSDLVSAGMPPSLLTEIRCGDGTLEEKWQKFRPYWQIIKNTAYCKALKIIVRDIYDVEDIDDQSYRLLSGKIASSNKNGWYKHVLRDMANIDACIVNFLGRGKLYSPALGIEDSLSSLDERLDMSIPPLGLEMLKPVACFDGLISIRNLKHIRILEEEYNTSIGTLHDLIKILDLSFEERIKEGIVGVKTVLAYNRSIHYGRTTQHEAENVFNCIFDHMGEGISWKEAKPLQDFLVHQLIQRAMASGLPVQVHTGLQEGNGNIIINSNPTHLVNLFIEYPRVKFDIFHASYPYTGELTTIVKNFPNVYADMCWMYVISPYVARRILSEWIETLPSNKIFAFGGDYMIVEGAYAHAKMARDNIARVLAEKVEEGYFSSSEAIEFARRILRDNSLEIFKF
jgi:predicted TIM-barrel fold metal-dependent hydrolase